MLSIKLKNGKAEVFVDGVPLPEIASLDITCADGSSRVAFEIINGDITIEQGDEKTGRFDSMDSL